MTLLVNDLLGEEFKSKLFNKVIRNWESSCKKGAMKLRRSCVGGGKGTLDTARESLSLSVPVEGSRPLFFQGFLGMHINFGV